MKNKTAQEPKSPVAPPKNAPPDIESPGAEPPAYLRIATILAERVTSGVYAAESRLPSGVELCREFGVSPMTMRRAINRLKDQGLLTGVKGKGTYARSPDLGDSIFRLDSLAGEWLDDSAEIRLLAASMARADEKVAEMLSVQPGERVVYLRRLVSYNSDPVMYHKEYITYDPHLPLVECQLQLTSLHAFLDSRSAHRFPHGELTLTAVNLDTEAAQALGRPEGSLALCLEHVFQTRERTPVSWGWFLMRAELFRLRAQLGLDQE